MGQIARWIGAFRGRLPQTAHVVSSQPTHCRTGQRGPAVIDLSQHWELTFALLDDTWAWRERAVDEFVLRDSDHVRATTAYQIRLPVELIQRFEATVQPGDEIRLLLPFAIRPKQLLLNAEFLGPTESQMTLLLRQVIAEIQAEYIEHVDGRPSGEQPSGGSLWVAISAYSDSLWREHLAATKPFVLDRLRSNPSERRRIDALVSYLNADLSLGIAASDVDRWLAELEPARMALVEALGEGDDPDSPSECVLLAIPFMLVRPGRIEDINILVSEFVRAVDLMGEPTRQVVAEYGRRWEAIVEITLPVGQACEVQVSEQRPWLRTPSPIMEQAVSSHPRRRSRALSGGDGVGGATPPPTADGAGHRNCRAVVRYLDPSVAGRRRRLGGFRLESCQTGGRMMKLQLPRRKEDVPWRRMERKARAAWVRSPAAAR